MGRVEPLNTKIEDSSLTGCVIFPHLVFCHSACHAVTVKDYRETDISSVISIAYNLRKCDQENLKNNYRISWFEMCLSDT